MSDNNLATKYRPTSFAEVVGQDIPKVVLRKLAAKPGISCKSVVLLGAYGTGKTTLSRIFAKALNCSHFNSTVAPDGTPKEKYEVCNQCDGCREASSPNSQCYLEFDATAMRSLDSLTELTNRLSFAPPKGSRRLVVLDEVHAAGKEVLNGLLKILEEGVPDTMFILATTDQFLPTIQSRSLVLDMFTIPPAEMRTRILQVAEAEHLDLSDSVIQAIINKSEGHMRNALSLLQLYTLSGEEALQSSYPLLCRFFYLTMQKKSDPELLKSILKFPLTDIRSSLFSFLRNCYAATPDDKLYPFKKSGTVGKLFQFFFTPVAQQALQDEYGAELILQDFQSKLIQS